MPTSVQIGIWYIVLVANVLLAGALVFLDLRGASVAPKLYLLCVVLIGTAVLGIRFARRTADFLEEEREKQDDP